jgi:hypothetical protein
MVMCASGAARAGSGAFIPPLKLDVGRMTEHVAGVDRVGGEMMLGINLATLYPKPMPFDLGVGWINVDVDGGAPPAMPLSEVTVDPAPAAVTVSNGWYVEASGLLGGGEHWRTWLTSRGEMFHGAGHDEYGAFVRVSGEVWAGAVGGDHSAAVCGVVALGAWAEVGERQEPDGERARVAATGLSLRVPLLIAN